MFSSGITTLMARLMKKRPLRVLDLPFVSILDRRPKEGQFILLSWDINGWCGYESTYWNKDDTHCKHAVAWLPLPENHVYSRGCALVLSKSWKTRMPILKWSTHFSRANNGKYISKERLAKTAYELSYPRKEHSNTTGQDCGC